MTRLAIALNVFLAPMLAQKHGIAVVAWYACAFLVSAVIVLVSPWLATTGVELEETNGVESGKPE
ncbi:hypothetical protein [Amycolatopsis lurida]|uniref:hypothetical protein n=1 Tax=Amycolatopsis lurida TaxID=31959 RepID=UPI00365EA004